MAGNGGGADVVPVDHQKGVWVDLDGETRWRICVPVGGLWWEFFCAEYPCQRYCSVFGCNAKHTGRFSLCRPSLAIFASASSRQDWLSFEMLVAFSGI